MEKILKNQTCYQVCCDETTSAEMIWK